MEERVAACAPSHAGSATAARNENEAVDRSESRTGENSARERNQSENQNRSSSRWSLSWSRSSMVRAESEREHEARARLESELFADVDTTEQNGAARGDTTEAANPSLVNTSEQPKALAAQGFCCVLYGCSALMFPALALALLTSLFASFSLLFGALALSSALSTPRSISALQQRDHVQGNAASIAAQDLTRDRQTPANDGTPSLWMLRLLRLLEACTAICAGSFALAVPAFAALAASRILAALAIVLGFSQLFAIVSKLMSSSRISPVWCCLSILRVAQRTVQHFWNRDTSHDRLTFASNTGATTLRTEATPSYVGADGTPLASSRFASAFEQSSQTERTPLLGDSATRESSLLELSPSSSAAARAIPSSSAASTASSVTSGPSSTWFWPPWSMQAPESSLERVLSALGLLSLGWFLLEAQNSSDSRAAAAAGVLALVVVVGAQAVIHGTFLLLAAAALCHVAWTDAAARRNSNLAWQQRLRSVNVSAGE
mmetsp:Transcript_10425/g.27731  ORF Transcript_10425/g.27731 Transcript_10425/m.27731 type:complete len:491 (+) Transcript_10425:187-1659(+)|eukprot:CAMPEP_0185831500 /NCGR_PEP_ID=MMETSP1353-20130828/1518_1 /TAXON_ID=1077150 /ORGANISM="Erythrolobus australicus, Strain CCMP3124" /LENGTH=490 /DNA_ID=CAMNT_0028529563 /DNA_START=177 /DNA_END=1649 /DNA_ORIENTATION=-